MCLVIRLLKLLLEHLNFLPELSSISFFRWGAQGHLLVQMGCLDVVLMMRVVGIIRIRAMCCDFVDLWGGLRLLLLNVMVRSALVLRFHLLFPPSLTKNEFYN